MRSGSAIDDSLPPSREVHIGSSGDQRLGAMVISNGVI